MPIATMRGEILVEDGLGGVDRIPFNARWSCGDSSSLGVKREKVSLTGSAFTALTPPSGATAVILRLGASVSLTQKGVTGDTGTTIAPTSNPKGVPFLIPLGASPSIGIANAGSTVTIEVIWIV